MDNTTQHGLSVLDSAKQTFAIALHDAQSLDIVNNMAAAFDGAIIINRLEEVLSDQVMQQVFMPLMNKKIGFLTDRDPNKPNKNGVRPTPYDIATVRTAIIDAAMVGLVPMGNQFNIISGQMYPAKAGYTALLNKLKVSMGLVYSFEFDPETTVKSSDPAYMAIPCRISYRTNRDDLKGYFKYVSMVKINGETSSTDQLRGKAERKCKKAFVEFLSGLDLGEGDPETLDVSYTEVSSQSPATPASSAAQQPTATEKARELLHRRAAAQQPKNEAAQNPAPAAPTTPYNPIQPNLAFDNQPTTEGGLQ